jgi:hypothetical protein
MNLLNMHGAFRIAKSLYHHSPFCLFRRRAAIEYTKHLEQIQREQDYIVKNLFSDSPRVTGGPFSGMRYLDSARCSALLPKLIGSYEEPIQQWVTEVVRSNRYQRIVDVGCAEGYYAVGFARALPLCEIFAFDIDDVSITLARRLAALNNISNISFGRACSHQELNDAINGLTLVFCDIEGAEEDLLDPAAAPSLAHADIIVETHDCFKPGISELLIDRFYTTHQILCAIDYPFRLRSYIHASTAGYVGKADIMTDEMRPQKMKFLFMRAKAIWVEAN